MKPTEAQIKEFWEWCGLFWGWSKDYSKPPFKEDYGAWFIAIGEKSCVEVSRKLPPIDLNSLFKYAVPKMPYVLLENCQAGYRASVSADMKLNPEATDRDPALALFWAIYEVIKNEVRD